MQAPHLAAAPIQAGNLSTPCIVRPVNLGFFDSSPLKHAFCSAQLLGVDWSGDWKAELTEFVRWLRDNYKEICKIFWQRLTSTWCTRNTSLITKMSYSECQIGHHNNILKAQTNFMILIFKDLKTEGNGNLFIMPHSVSAAEKCVLQKVPVNENKNLFFILGNVKHECHGIFLQLVIQWAKKCCFQKYRERPTICTFELGPIMRLTR